MSGEKKEISIAETNQSRKPKKAKSPRLVEEGKGSKVDAVITPEKFAKQPTKPPKKRDIEIEKVENFSNTEATADKVVINSKPISSTLLIHGDGKVADGADVAPPIHVSTTFDQKMNGEYAYSRIDTPTRDRVEAILSQLDGGHALTFSSGLSAISAVVFNYNPKRIFKYVGYFAVHSICSTFQNLRDGETEIIEISDEDDKWIETLREKDLVMIEMPMNPRCLLYDLEKIAAEVKRKKGKIVVDATFSSPIGIRPLDHNVDFVVHSATKYLGGHSDLLCGVVVCKDFGDYARLKSTRNNIGNVMGSLEAFLLLRSLRTLKLRVKRQSKTANKVANYLATHPKVKVVWHTSLPTHPHHEIAKKYLKLHPACFSFEVHDRDQAKQLPEFCELLKNATSLGGYESLIEWRHKHDATQSPLLLRITVGLESTSDIVADLDQALNRPFSPLGHPSALKKTEQKQECCIE